MCLATSKNLLLTLQDAIFFSFFSHKLTISWSAKNNNADIFFHPQSPFPCNFCEHNCFAIPGSTSIVIHSMNQRLLRNWAGSGSCGILWLVQKNTKGTESCKPTSLNCLIAKTMGDSCITLDCKEIKQRNLVLPQTLQHSTALTNALQKKKQVREIYILCGALWLCRNWFRSDTELSLYYFDSMP